MEGADGARVDVASLWVHLTAEGRPARLPAWFVDTYGAAALGRTVSSRLALPAPPADADARPWALRATDLDVLGHVNNAATWAAVEDELAAAGAHPWRAELEYAAAIEPGEICKDDPETQRAFDESLRALAEDIVQYHPGLAHILIGMSKTPCPIVHGQN